MDDHPDDFSQWESNSQINEARRRRRKHGFQMPTKGDRAALMAEIAGRLVVNADFFIFSLLCALILMVAILSDSPAIYILAALVAPFLAPVVGFGFATVVGSARFFLQSLGSFIIGGLFMFAGGAIAGWISKLIPERTYTQLQYHVKLTLPDFILLTIGILLAIYITVKVPKNRSLVASVALAYELYLPIGVAGFGVTSGMPGLFPEGLELVGLYTAWMIFIGTIFLAFLKIRPFTFFGYFLTAVILAVAAYILLSNSGIGSAVRQQMAASTPTPTPTMTRQVIFSSDTPAPQTTANMVETPSLPADSSPSAVFTPSGTISLVPTEISTATITPKPTPVYGRVYSSTPENTGVNIRKSPAGDYLMMVPVDTLVEILDSELANGNTWVHIRVVESGQEGWISQGLLLTATPQVDW